MTMPVYVPGMHIDDNGNVVIHADEMAAAGVSKLELIERRAPHTHYCQMHDDRWTCSDTACDRADVFGCPELEAQRNHEEFARDIAHKLGIEYAPPVVKGECVYLAAIERLKEQLAEANREREIERSFKDQFIGLSGKLQETIEALCEGKSKAEAQLDKKLQRWAVELEAKIAQLVEAATAARDLFAAADQPDDKWIENKLTGALKPFTTAPIGGANQVLAVLTKVEAYMAGEDGPICKLWEDGDIGNYDDTATDWEQTLFDVRDYKNDCVPTASLGYGTEWPVITLYREVLAALAPEALPAEEGE